MRKYSKEDDLKYFSRCQWDIKGRTVMEVFCIFNAAGESTNLDKDASKGLGRRHYLPLRLHEHSERRFFDRDVSSFLSLC